ncbi:zinc dependent phospholipase C family protein [Exiguobacterium sp. ERU656]|uniref:zinc dependent phospholipase C family protein n=1 Tax=Exiguobacterium sp. ERU656 TaxID=2751217 RepID=UPI001BE64C81|nr:zinc dependent phospholipase C family protein [Exiguobacterium sp. ERU656]
MGSRIMHYCIASLLADKLKPEPRSDFLLGGIAPDIHGLMGVPKGKTHFKDLDENGKNRINLDRFLHTYETRLAEPFYLGYLCHLISDQVWLAFYLEKVAYVSREQWQADLEKSYRDFNRLNGRIIKLYELKLSPLTVPLFEIEGYDQTYLPTLIDELALDFQLDASLETEKLEFYKNHNQEITSYINQAVNSCLKILSNQVGITINQHFPSFFHSKRINSKRE